VQKSGQLAIEALRGSERVQEAPMLCYGTGCSRPTRVVAGKDLCSHSRVTAALRALYHRGRAEVLLFWHLDLLKLLPLLGRNQARVYLFLHGVECWRPATARMQNLLAGVDLFLTNSDFTWNRFLEYNPRWDGAMHRTVPLGLDGPEQDVASPAPEPVAIIVGRMDRMEDYKGHRELIEAWPAVLRSVNEAQLWIVGGGDAAVDLKARAAALGVEKQTRFFGVVPEREKQALLRSARCLVLPSRGEGFGLAYLEAMRIGRPCLTSTEDAGREVVGPPEAGLAVDPADVAGLAASVVRLLTPGREWQEWSAGARRRYESSFTAGHFQERLLDAMFEKEAI
jgi:phosphatidylinositol alpha-1,6-mannosyltransferase